MIHELSDWLSQSALGDFIQRNSWVADWVVPGAQTVHIVCVSVVMTSMAMLDFRLLGVGAAREPAAHLATRLLPWVWYALGILLLTGVTLTLVEPARELLSPAFRAKMVLLVSACALTFSVQRALQRDPGYFEGRRPQAILTGALSLGLWVAILSAGRWIAYLGQE
jgi:hypothetical protein